MGEHVVPFDETGFPYPGSRDGRLPVPEGGGLLDTVATFGFLAAATTTLRLWTGITLLPQRNPIYTAKQKPHIPIIVGGHSRAAMKRAVQFGSGCYGFALNVDTTRLLVEQLDETLQQAGRSRSDFEVVVTPNAVTDDDVRAFAGLGVDRLIVQLGSQRPDAIAKRVVELERLVQLCR